MAASTITRDTWTNDSGTTSVPVGDGTILANTVLQNHIYARIDAMFAGAGAYATFTLGGKLTVEGFGATTFSAGGTGGQTILLRNTTAGTGNYAGLVIANDNDTILTQLVGFSSTYTTSTYAQASGTMLYAHGAGGLSVVTAHPTGDIRFYPALTERMRLWFSGGLSINNTTDPGVNNMTVSSQFVDDYLSASHGFIASGGGNNTLTVQNTSAGTGNYASVNVGNDTSASLLLIASLSSTFTPGTDTAANGSVIRQSGAGGLSIAVNTAQPMRFYTNNTERARFLSTGELAMNSTSVTGGGILGVSANAGSSQVGISIVDTNIANSLSYMVFYNSSSGVAGSIGHTGATTVAFNTSSDARLKIDGGRAQDLSGLRGLVIHDFTWASDGIKDRGVFAQEAFSVMPEAVTRGSDDMTKDGKMLSSPWMVNYQKFIPHLVTGWQEHDATIADLRQRLAKLEAA